MIFLPHTNTVVLLELYCGTITEPGLPVLQRETSRNFLVTRFMEEISYVFPFSFFTAAHFHIAMVAASISHFVTATKFSRCSSNKKNVSFGFLSLALNPSHPFSRWASLACRPLSLALYSKIVDMTIYLKLILYTTLIQKQFSLSVFVFIDSFFVSALRFPAKITSSCIWVALPVD